MIVERDGVQLHLHPSNEPPTGHGAFWIRVSEIEALYEEYLAVNVIASSNIRSRRSPGASNNFHICDPFRNIFIFAENSRRRRGDCLTSQVSRKTFLRTSRSISSPF